MLINENVPQFCPWDKHIKTKTTFLISIINNRFCLDAKVLP